MKDIDQEVSEKLWYYAAWWYPCRKCIRFGFGKEVEVLKPLGDIFLNLLFTAIIPLVFFYHIGINYFRKPKTRKVILNRNWSLLFTVLVSAILWLSFDFPIHQDIIISKIR
jgi:hypothetical protein